MGEEESIPDRQCQSTPDSGASGSQLFGIRSYLHLLYERGSQDIVEDDGEDDDTGPGSTQQAYSFIQPRESSDHRLGYYTCFRVTLILSLLGLIGGSLLAAAGFIMSPNVNHHATRNTMHHPLDDAVKSFVHSRLSMSGLVLLGVSALILSCNLLLPVLASTQCGQSAQKWLLARRSRCNEEDAAQLIRPSSGGRKRSLSRIPVNQSFESIQPSREGEHNS